MKHILVCMIMFESCGVSRGIWLQVDARPDLTCGMAVFADGRPAAGLSVAAFTEAEMEGLPENGDDMPLIVRDTGGVRSSTNAQGEFCLGLQAVGPSDNWIVQIRGRGAQPATVVLRRIPKSLAVVVIRK